MSQESIHTGIDYKVAQNLAVIGILAAFVLISYVSARKLTLTYDEDQHYRYGLQILNLNSNRFDDSKMPFSAMNALPGKIASFLPDEELRTRLEDITAGRLFTMLFSVLVGLLIYRWSKELYGFIPGLLSLILYTWDPNIIAHSQLVTTDIFAVGMMAFSTYALWRFSKNRDLKHALFLAIILGLSQLAKYTSIFLYPLFVVLILIKDAPFLKTSLQNKDFRKFGDYLTRMTLYAVLVVVVSILIINIGFLFNRTGNPISSYKFRSDTFNRIQSRIMSISDLPVPLPYPYLQGLDDVRQRERSGRGYGNIYLFGQLNKEGFPGYYFYAFVYKVPLATQIIFLLSIGVYLFQRKYHHFLEDELFLLGPLLFLTVYFNFFYQAQIGIRFFLVAFPFIFIFSGNLAQGWQTFNRGRKIVIISLVSYLMISVLSYFPNYIPYFNEFALDRRLAYKILADSNLDWGQADGYALDYLEKHPNTLIELDQPAAGDILISANDLVGITAAPETYQWLRENFLPTRTVAYAYLLFEVSPEQLERIVAPP
jgi:hypothetical protein